MKMQMEKGLPKRQLRIRNKRRFVLVITIVLLVILALFIPSKTDGHVAYKPYMVAYRDTYWDIAKELQARGYKPRADIRDVVHELIEKSGIMAHELREGDIIYVPILEVGE